MKTKTTNVSLEAVRSGEKLTMLQALSLTVSLSIPAILAMLSSVVMQYIDASMVGRLGPEQSAAIGLVSSTTWLTGGICSAAGTGFTVLIAQRIGAKRDEAARTIMRHGLLGVLAFSSLMGLLCALISPYLPIWLGADASIRKDAYAYFLVYALSLPALQTRYTAGGMLQCSGEMRVPGVMNTLMCLLDVIFNALLIFPSGTLRIPVLNLYLPGAGLGVAGAALGTALAQLVCAGGILYFLLFVSEKMRLRRNERGWMSGSELSLAVRLAIPVAFESMVTGGAQVVSTRIVSPLGNIALAANSFAVTAESLCYMPGYGIAAAATTLIGQSTGAGRKHLTRRLSWLSVFLGMAVMSLSGVLMYLFAPAMIGFLSPNPDIIRLGTRILRIEAFAEPMFAASIVTNGVLRGMGETLFPSFLNLFCMWAVRLTLAGYLAPRIGLRGVWIAMALDLTIRGLLFLLLLFVKQRKEMTNDKTRI